MILITSRQLSMYLAEAPAFSVTKRSRRDAIRRDIDQAEEELGGTPTADQIMMKLKSFSGRGGCSVAYVISDGVLWQRDGAQSQEKLTMKLLRSSATRNPSALTHIHCYIFALIVAHEAGTHRRLLELQDWVEKSFVRPKSWSAPHAEAAQCMMRLRPNFCRDCLKFSAAVRLEFLRTSLMKSSKRAPLAPQTTRSGKSFGGR